MLAPVAQHALKSRNFKGGGKTSKVQGQPPSQREFKASLGYETLPQKVQNSQGLSVSTVDSKCGVAGLLSLTQLS